MLFLGCVFISDLYLHQDIVHLNNCFKFSKYLMLSFKDKVITLEINVALFKVASFSANKQFLVHDKSGSTSQLIQ